VVEGYVHFDKGMSAQVELEMEATVTEGFLPAVEIPDDHDEDFSAEVLREANLLGLDESEFLASVFDVPQAIKEDDPLFTDATTEGEPPFTDVITHCESSFTSV